MADFTFGVSTFGGADTFAAGTATTRAAEVTWAQFVVPAATPRRAAVTWASLVVPSPSGGGTGGVGQLDVLGPVNVTAPTLSGTAAVGSTLTITPGTWATVGLAGRGSLAAGLQAPAGARLRIFPASLAGVGHLAAGGFVDVLPPPPPPPPPPIISSAGGGLGSFTFGSVYPGQDHAGFGVAPPIAVGFSGMGGLAALFNRVVDRFSVGLSGRGGLAATLTVTAAPPPPPPPPPPPAPGGIGVSHFAPTTRYLVEVAWGMSWATGGLFKFGSSTFGGPDKLGAASFSASFAVPYGDLTDRTRHISIVRGRDDLLSTMQGGTVTIDLRDADGLLNSRNTASPLYGTLYTGVPVRVSAYTSWGLQVPIYYGFINTITSDPAGRYGNAQITATDFFSRMSQEKPNLGSLDGLTTGSLIQALITAMGWTDPNLIDLAVGDTLPNGYTRADGTRDVLSLIEEALQTERGYFYVAGDGTVRYISRSEIQTRSPAASLDRVMTGAPSTLDDSRIVNRWTVTRTDMVTDQFISGGQTAAVNPTSDVSYQRYHYIDGGISSPLLVDDNQALSLAQYLLSLTKNPTGVGWSIPINPPDPATLDQIIQRDLGDVVRLTVDPDLWPGYTSDFTIERVQHDIATDGAGPRHVTTWGVSEVPLVRPFVFGTSVFGGTDVLVY